jgi:hypothetical protein
MLSFKKILNDKIAETGPSSGNLLVLSHIFPKERRLCTTKKRQRDEGPML